MSYNQQENIEECTSNKTKRDKYDYVGLGKVVRFGVIFLLNVNMSRREGSTKESLFAGSEIYLCIYIHPSLLLDSINKKSRRISMPISVISM